MRGTVPRWFLAALLLVPGGASAGRWVSAPEPGVLAFTPRFEGQEIPGRFGQFTVQLATPPGREIPTALTVRVEISSAAFEDGDVQDEASGPDWMDVAQYPAAAFRSETIEATADGAWIARGQLTLRGVTRPVALPFRFEVGADTARITGAVVLDRRAFGIGAGEWAEDDSIAFDVSVNFDARLARDDAP